MSLRILLPALAQLIVFFAVGHLIVDLLLRLRRAPSGDRTFGTPERWLLSAFGFTLWAVLMMLLHLVTGGALFATPWVVPIATVGLVLVWLRAGPRLPRTDPKRWVWPALLGLVLIALYALPAIEGGSSLRTGDPPWHLGWTEQLLGGDPTPTGPAPEFARNAYPWGLHAVLATMVRLIPSSDPLIAHEALQLVLIALIPLGAACLARLVNRRAGLAAACVASLIGGFGWVTSGGPDLVASPSAARYGADLVVASPNSVYELLPPALPRELGLVLLACAAILLSDAFARRAWRAWTFGGAAVGVVGLVSVPMALSAAGWALAMLLANRRWRAVPFVAGGALAAFALWAVPIVSDYVRYGGFVNVTPTLGVEWPLPTALASWGLLLPLCVAGLVLCAMQPSAVRRNLLPYVAASVVLLTIAVARGAFDWGLLGNETLLHQGRFWPPAHLLASALGGIALLQLYGYLSPRWLGAGVSAAVIGVGAISPLYASMEMADIIREEKHGFLYGSADLREGSFLRRAAAQMDPDEVMLVVEGDLLAFYLWQFSGARIADDNAGALESNPHRIRFRTLAERWREKEQGTGFDFDWVFSKRRGHDPSDVRATGTFRGVEWLFFSTHD